MNRILFANNQRNSASNNDFTIDSFVLLMEEMKQETSATLVSYPTLAAQHLSWEILNPAVPMPKTLSQGAQLLPVRIPIPDVSWVCGLHVVSLRPLRSAECKMPSAWAALLLHPILYERVSRPGNEFRPYCSPHDPNNLLEVKSQTLYNAKEVIRTSVAMTTDSEVYRSVYSWITLKPMEITSLKIKISRP